MKKLIFWLPLLMLVLTGCGGGLDNSFTLKGVVTGNLTDVDGKAIVSADVWVDGTSVTTQSTQMGIYRLTNVPEGYQIVKSRIYIDGVEWTGQNVVNLVVDYASNQAKSINITMAPSADLGGMDGYVYDSNGNPLIGARVFAVSDSELSAATDITDNNGYYRIWGLISGLDYMVTASAQGYENEQRNNQRVNVGSYRRISFNCSYSYNPRLNAPTGVYAIAWTVPSTVYAPQTASSINAYSAIKAQLTNRKNANQKIAASSTRSTPAGSNIEIDLNWTYINDSSLMGYGVYRGTSSGSISSLDYLRDPLANFYADQDRTLTPDVRYYYQLTALNTDYPDYSGSESSRSAIVSAMPLESFGSAWIDAFQMRFSWNAVAGASNYRVVVYPIYPDWNVEPVADVTLGNVTSWNYNGSSLTSGHTYYFVVTASADWDGYDYTANSISGIESFVKP